jgi:SAM-dependent methyltransferase
LHFYDYAGLSYTPLQDVVKIPYASDSFDAIIASGVLEHVAMDYESLKEIYRILKPDGVLIISYLPNWLSVNEWFRRVIRKQAFHRRLYRMGGTRQLLKRAGFCPVDARHHIFLRDRILENVPLDTLLPTFNILLTTLLPANLFSSVLRIIARKVTCM